MLAELPNVQIKKNRLNRNEKFKVNKLFSTVCCSKLLKLQPILEKPQFEAEQTIYGLIISEKPFYCLILSPIRPAFLEGVCLCSKTLFKYQF